MKRKHVEQYEHGVYPCRTIISWRTCSKCTNDFRRERGYCFVTGPFYGGQGHWKFLCASCAPSKYVANKLAIEGLCTLEPPTDVAEKKCRTCKKVHIGPDVCNPKDIVSVLPKITRKFNLFGCYFSGHEWCDGIWVSVYEKYFSTCHHCEAVKAETKDEYFADV